jgi:hypothetical protein
MSKAKATLEPIRNGEGLIPLPQFLRRTGQKSHSWMTAKRKAAEAGITIAYQHGRRVYVDADAWISYLKLNPVSARRRSRELVAAE